MSLTFTCSKCGKHRIEEVQQGVCVATEILEISDDDLTVLYGEQANEGGQIDRYRCRQCGWVIPKAGNEEELVEFLGAK